jgi:hypothetical protein
VLLDVIADHDLYMTLPKYIPTLRALVTQNLTRPDNVFASLALQEVIIKCDMCLEDQPAHTDIYVEISHLACLLIRFKARLIIIKLFMFRFLSRVISQAAAFPIDTVLAIQTQRTVELPRCNFRDVKWEKFREMLREKIDKEVPSTPILTTADLMNRTGLLTKSITNRIDEKVPPAMFWNPKLWC